MSGKYPRNECENHQTEKELEVGSVSERLYQIINAIEKDNRSLKNTNSRENTEITVETARMINAEICN